MMYWPIGNFRCLINIILMASTEFSIQRMLTEPLNGNDKWWLIIRQKYNESQRHYHTMQHIRDMWTAFTEYSSKLKQPELVAYATIFHDAIYDPTLNTNEELSGQLFRDFVKDVQTYKQDELLQNETNCVKVYDWILLTKSHKTEAHTTPNVYGSEDYHYFLDFDMQVLGWQADKYDIYASKIRQEYIHIPEDEYKMKRAQVLRSFLKVPNIYATKEFRDKYELQARNNIVREIETLE